MAIAAERTAQSPTSPLYPAAWRPPSSNRNRRGVLIISPPQEKAKDAINQTSLSIDIGGSSGGFELKLFPLQVALSLVSVALLAILIQHPLFILVVFLHNSSG